MREQDSIDAQLVLRLRQIASGIQFANPFQGLPPRTKKIFSVALRRSRVSLDCLSNDVDGVGKVVCCHRLRDIFEGDEYKAAMHYGISTSCCRKKNTR
jgi:hypothetical protein